MPHPSNPKNVTKLFVGKSNFIQDAQAWNGMPPYLYIRHGVDRGSKGYLFLDNAVKSDFPFDTWVEVKARRIDNSYLDYLILEWKLIDEKDPRLADFRQYQSWKVVNPKVKNE